MLSNGFVGCGMSLLALSFRRGQHEHSVPKTHTACPTFAADFYIPYTDPFLDGFGHSP
jgi:hypothetical protein